MEQIAPKFMINGTISIFDFCIVSFRFLDIKCSLAYLIKGKHISLDLPKPLQVLVTYKALTFLSVSHSFVFIYLFIIYFLLLTF